MSRSNGYSTGKRTKILDYLVLNSDKDVSVKDIELYLVEEEQMSINVTTIYRYLDKLEKEGLVLRHTGDSDGKASFQYVKPDNNCHGHLHMKCSKCGVIKHLDCEFMAEFEKHIMEEHNFVIECKSSMIYGICENCREVLA